MINEGSDRLCIIFNIIQNKVEINVYALSQVDLLIP